MKVKLDIGLQVRGKPTTSKQSIKKAVRKIYLQKWKNNMTHKSTLALYKHKNEWGKNPWLGHDETTVRWIRCRIGDIHLHHRTAHWKNHSDKCSFCPAERETLIHVLVTCPGYHRERHRAIENLRTHI